MLNMSFQLSSEPFRTMIFHDWKIALTYKDCHTRLVQAWGATHFPTTQSLIGFGEFQRNKLNLVFKMLLTQVVLQHLLLNKQLMLSKNN